MNAEVTNIDVIQVYSWATPNGHKVHIMMEECGYVLGRDWQVIPINIGKGDQFTPEFLAISPNNKIPALVDPQGPDHRPFALFESGAILYYLAQKKSQFLPTEPRLHYQVMQWLMFQMGGMGPMLGQAHHFRIYAPEKIDYAINRYTNEAKRLYKVMNQHLLNRRYFVAEDYSIADIAIYPWLRSWKNQGIDWADYPALKQWFDTISERPAVIRGCSVLTDMRTPFTDPQSRENLFGKQQYKS